MEWSSRKPEPMCNWRQCNTLDRQQCKRWGKKMNKVLFKIVAPFWHMEVEKVFTYLRLTLVFMWNSALRQKFNFCFSRVFCYYSQNLHLGMGTGSCAIILWGLDTFLVLSNFLRFLKCFKSFSYLWGNWYIPCL